MPAVRDLENIDRTAIRDWIGDRSQDEAASLLGVSQGYLSKWLLHDRELSRIRAIAWHTITGIPIETLVLKASTAA